jgi:HlyD family secretion protein
VKYLLWLLAIGSAGTVTGLVVLKGTAPDQIDGVAKSRWGAEIHGIGYVEPRSEARRLGVRGSGVLGELRVERGQQCRSGDLIAALRNQEETAAVQVAEREVELAKAELRVLLAGAHPDRVRAAEIAVAGWREAVRLSRRRMERTGDTVKTGGTSRDEFEAAEYMLRRDEAALRSAEAELNQLQNQVREQDRRLAEAKVKRAEAKLEEARRRLDETRLVAPFDGRVLEVYRRGGECVNAIPPEPVVLFADTTRLWVRAEVDERSVARLREGLPAVVCGRGLGDREFPGRVASVKCVMGKKRVFAGAADERHDLDVLEVFIEAGPSFDAPIGLRVDVRVRAQD